MSEAINRMIAILEKGISEMETLVQDSLNVAKMQLPQDTEAFMLHRAEVIKVEVDFLRKQIETIIQRSE